MRVAMAAEEEEGEHNVIYCRCPGPGLRRSATRSWRRYPPMEPPAHHRQVLSCLNVYEGFVTCCLQTP
jgi:hypothetical protein